MDFWREEYEKGMRLLAEMPLREDYKARLEEKLAKGCSMGLAVEEVLKEGRGDDFSDGLLREYASEENVRYIGEMWERDCGEMRQGREPDGYLEEIVMERCPSVLCVREDLRGVADGVYEAMGYIFSWPDGCHGLLREASAKLREIAEKLERMDYLRVDYSGIDF